MKLKEWLKLRKIRVSDMARDLNLSHTVVLRWSKDLRIPTKENMELVFKYTGGLVQPNDFYDLGD